jgi:hypothetical protein
LGWLVFRISTKKQTHTSSLRIKFKSRSRVRSASALKKASLSKLVAFLLILKNILAWLAIYGLTDIHALRILAGIFAYAYIEGSALTTELVVRE